MKKTYSEKYKSPQWQKKRLEIMSRDEFHCMICGCEDSTLAVHHSYYVSGRDPWQYPDWSLRTLCESCHRDLHGENAAETGLQEWEETIELIIGNENPSDGRLHDFGLEVKKFINTFSGLPENRLGRFVRVLSQTTKDIREKSKK